MLTWVGEFSGQEVTGDKEREGEAQGASFTQGVLGIPQSPESTDQKFVLESVAFPFSSL